MDALFEKLTLLLAESSHLSLTALIRVAWSANNST